MKASATKITKTFSATKNTKVTKGTRLPRGSWVEHSGLCVLCGLIVFVFFGASSSAAGESDVADAVQKRDNEAVRALLQRRADVNAAQGDGATALHWAAHWDDVEMVELLIRAGANVNAANDYGVTALALACENQNSQLVEKLLEARANPNAAQTTGVTPLMECTRTGTLAAAKSLLARGASVQATHAKTGQTALMWAAAAKRPELVKLLIEQGANARVRSKGGFTALMFAARSGDQESTRLLLDAGANVDEATPEQGSALVLASASGHEALAISLLDKGANPNAADKNGITALHNAVQRGLTALIGVRYDDFYRLQPQNMPDLVKALLARGADPNAQIKADDVRGPDGTPFSMKGATPYFLAAVAGDAALMRLLGKAGANPRLLAEGDVTPLMAAARSACTGSCEFKGANLEVDDAAAASALEAVKVALELGVDVNAANEDGQTAIHMAAFTGADGVVQLLADKGANVEVRDKRGETPWSMAAGLSTVLRYRGLYGSHESTAKLLEKLGAKPVTQEELEARAAAGR